jgi:predicted RNA-binding Zn ribbon-like protein
MARAETPPAGKARVPDEAVAIVELLNSRPHGTPLLPDALDCQETAARILQPFNRGGDTELSPQTLERVRAIRSDLMAVVTAADADDAARGWAQLTDHASAVAFRQVFTHAGTTDLCQTAGDPIVGGIARTVADLIGSDRWSRIRMCANDACNHAFYDTTRSRTGRWHSYEVCGNRSNVAAFRARQASRTPHPVGDVSS